MNKKMIFNYPIDIDGNNPLYYVLYDFIGMYDGWIVFNYNRYNECKKILEDKGWIKWI